ncbi:MAG: tRNA (N(6)-L-threonylcarbamoyladenosine(37)-C(2))-methylthiotransferase MtaB [Oscillospiraceae bacterium]|nr:tRNA (N(6)-L-threonylcarbamoyladenosine(37)-C(2))-methylthiotransferase MtaB [Oscillospiraceae bacterium]
MNIYFFTFGCKVNQYETESIRQLLTAAGHTPCSSENEAGLFVINSCTVTHSGDKKWLKLMRRLRREYPESIILLTGCFPQAFPEKSAELSEADIICGTKDRSRIPELIENYLASRSKTVSVIPHKIGDAFENAANTEFHGHTRAFVKIQDGCDRYCTYCIIPYSRGHIRSKSLDVLRSEAEVLAASGYKEIVLVGINLSFYGAEMGIRLADAVELVGSIDGIERVRLGSLEPELITDDDIRRFAAIPKFCPQFHISLQSGCDRTLKAMNRHYTSAEYYELAEKLRATFRDCSLTTDIMTGFPGETEEDFAESLEFVRKVGFADGHIFPYSKRSGTKAAEMPEQISEEIKNRRAAEMSKIVSQSKIKFLEKQVGNIYPVLFEKEKSVNFHQGHTPNQTLVKIFRENSSKSLRKQILYVKIEGIENDHAIGRIIENI